MGSARLRPRAAMFVAERLPWLLAVLAWVVVVAGWLWVATLRSAPSGGAASPTALVVHLASDDSGRVWSGLEGAVRTIPAPCRIEVSLEEAGRARAPAQRPTWSRPVPTPNRLIRPRSPVTTYLVAYVREDAPPFELSSHAYVIDELLVRADAARLVGSEHAMAVVGCSLAAHSALVEGRWSDARELLRHVARADGALAEWLALLTMDLDLLATTALCDASPCNETLGSSVIEVLREVDPRLVPSDGVAGVSRWHMRQLPSEMTLSGAVTDLRGIEHAAHLTSLTVHHLEHEERPPLDLAPLAGLTSLMSLVLGPLTVTNLAPLSDLSSLRHLSLLGTSFSPLPGLGCGADPLAPLGGLELTHLAVPDVETSLACLETHSALASLRELDVSGHVTVRDTVTLPESRPTFPRLETILATGASAEVIDSLEAPLLRHLEAPWPVEVGSATAANRGPALDRFEHLERVDLSHRAIAWSAAPFSSNTALRHLVLKGVDLPEHRDRWSDYLPAGLVSLDLSTEAESGNDACSGDTTRLELATLPVGLEWLHVGGRCITDLDRYHPDDLLVLCTHGARLYGAPSASTHFDREFRVETWFVRYLDEVNEAWWAWLDSFIEDGGELPIIDPCPEWEPA